MKYLLSFFLLIAMTVYIPVLGQNIVDGTVLNKETEAPLPYAHILVKHTERGTASNIEGDFSVEVVPETDTLVVSYVGFETKEVPLSEVDSPLTVSLTPSVAGESELNVTDNYEINMVEKAIEKITSSGNERAFGKAFYRQLTQSGATYTEFIETFYDAELSPNHIEQWKVDEGRYAVIPYDSLRYTMYHRNLSIFSRIELVDQPPYRSTIIWPLRDDTREYYQFYLEKTYPGDTENILEISFEEKGGLPKPGFEGTLIMTDSTHQILELSVHINDPNFNPISPLAKKAEVKNTTLEIVFTRISVNNEQPFPNRISVNLAYDYFKNKGLFGKTDFEKRIETQSILYFYDYEMDGLSQYLTDTYFDENSDISDYRRIEKTDYNPQFWVDNAVIKHTPVEQEVINSFEEYGSFGKMFNQDN